MADPSEAAATRRYPLLQPIGRTGLRSNSGYIREELLPELSGTRGREKLLEMATQDATCGAVLFAIKTILKSSKWSIEASDANDARATEAKEFVEGVLFEDMNESWPEFIDSACSMFTYGFATMEILWKKRNGPNVMKPWLASDFDDGLYGIRRVSNRSQRSIIRWVYDDDENLLGFEQQPWNDVQRVVPLSRCVHFRTTTENSNPEGRSLLVTAYRSWYFLKRLQEIEGIGTERDLAGYPVLRVPSDILDPNGSTEAQQARTQFETLLRNIRRDEQEGVLLPSDRDEGGNLFYEFELLSAGGSRQMSTSESIDRYQRDIARSVLADFIFLGADGGGSLALGNTKVTTFARAMQSYLGIIAGVVNEQLIHKLWLINGLDADIRPTLKPEELDPADLAALASFLKTLADVGYDLASDKQLEQHLRGQANLPDAPDDETDPVAAALARATRMEGAPKPEDGGVRETVTETVRETVPAEEPAEKAFMKALMEATDGWG